MSSNPIDPSSLDWHLQKPVWQASTLFVDAREAIERLRSQFTDAGVSLNPTSELAQLMDRTARFVSAPEHETGSNELLERAVIQGQFLDRISRACEGIKGTSNERQHLARIKHGSIDPGSRDPSPAKDKLFELEFISIFHENSLSAELSEPDIVVESEFGKVDVACKRIYSRRNAESQISKGIRQLDNSDAHKILALCLDDLIPPYTILVAGTPEEGSAMLETFASDFLSRVDKKIYRYMENRRVSFVVASTTTPARYVSDEGYISALTHLFLFMPAPHLGAISVEARQLGDRLFLRSSKRWQER